MARRIVIALDTNYLINALVPGSPEAAALFAWHRNGEVLAAPSVVWYEFLCGPVSVREIELIRALLRGGVITYGEPEATEAARLFNATGRSRRLRVDAMIAACALVSGAGLATSNQSDFQAFVPHGLNLLPPSQPVPAANRPDDIG